MMIATTGRPRFYCSGACAQRARLKTDPERVRAVKNAWNAKHRDQKAAYDREYRLKNQDEIAAWSRTHYLQNREQVLDQQREYYRANSEAIKKRTRKWAKANPEKVRAYKQAWVKKNREKVNKAGREGVARRKARLLQVGGSLSRRDWDRLVLRFEGRCAYCGEPATSQDHVIPLSRGGRAHDRQRSSSVQALQQPEGKTLADRMVRPPRRLREGATGWPITPYPCLDT
jgi:5-methylcytosine-specific restriction endonuclease McrA